MTTRYKLRRSSMRPRHQGGYVEERGSKKNRYFYGHYNIYIEKPDGTSERQHKGEYLGHKSTMRKWEAEEKLRQIIADRQPHRVSKPDGAMTLEWFTEHRFLPMKSPSWRPATDRGNRFDIKKYIVPTLGAVALDDLSRLQCQGLLYALGKKGFSEPLILRCRTMLKSVLEMAVDMDFIRKNPAKSLDMPDCKATPKPVLSKDDLRLLLEAVTDPRDHLILMLGTFCGLRASELFGLKCGSYHGEIIIPTSTAWNGKLYEGKTKTQKSRAPIYLPEIVQLEIEKWKKLHPKWRPDALMFPTANGTPLEPRNFLRDCVKPKLGLHVTFQILRRSAGTRNQKHGSMKDVQALMRHSSIETTANVYMQPIPESVKQMQESDVADVLGSPSGRIQ